MDTPSLIVVGVFAWLTMCLTAAYCSRVRRRPGWEGFVFGLLYGPLGILIAAVLDGDRGPVSRFMDDPDKRPAESDDGPERIDFAAIPGPRRR